jgi:hypothetical protein
MTNEATTDYKTMLRDDIRVTMNRTHGPNGGWELVDGNSSIQSRRYLVFDGWRGQSMGEAIQDLAAMYGWDGDPVPFASDDYEGYDDASVTAEEYLDDLLDGSPFHLAHDDGYFACELRDTRTVEV